MNKNYLTLKINVPPSLLSPFAYYYIPVVASLVLYYLEFSTLFTSGYTIESLLSLIIILALPSVFFLFGKYEISSECIINFDVEQVVKTMTLLSTVAYLIQIEVLGLPPMFTPRNKTEYFVFGVSLFFYLAQFATPLAIIWWKISGNKYSLVFFFWNLLMLITLMNKNPVIQSLCVSFVVYLCFSEKMVSNILLKVSLFLTFALTSIYSMFYFNPVFNDYAGYFELLKNDQGVEAIDDPLISLIYMYIASGWENFFNYINSPTGYTYGTMFFQPLIKLFKFDAWLPMLEYQDLVPGTLKNKDLTVATGFFRMYSDFGFSSLFLYLALYFGFTFRLARAIRHSCKLTQLYILVYLNIFLLFMFFDNYFFLTISVFGLGVFFILTKIFRKSIRVVL